MIDIGSATELIAIRHLPRNSQSKLMCTILCSIFCFVFLPFLELQNAPFFARFSTIQRQFVLQLIGYYCNLPFLLELVSVNNNNKLSQIGAYKRCTVGLEREMHSKMLDPTLAGNHKLKGNYYYLYNVIQNSLFLLNIKKSHFVDY